MASRWVAWKGKEPIQMDIAVYHPWIHCRGGGEKVLLKLLEKSQHDIKIYTNRYVPETTYAGFQNHEIIEILDIPMRGELLRGVTFTLGAAATDLPMGRHDALVVSTGGIAEAVNFGNTSKPLIGLCHTPLRVVHDEEIRHYKAENMSPARRMLYELAVRTYELIEQSAWRRFDHVIFNSQTTRERAISDGLIEEEPTSVIHPGSETKGNKSAGYGNYFLYPSRFAYYKRQDLALEAYERFRERNPDTRFRLVVAGGVDEENEDYFKQIKARAETIKGVETKPNVPADQWKSLYSNAYAVLFCAINEDWGIVPIEAGSYEKPVISVNEGGPAESVVHGETGFLVNDLNSMVSAMERVTADESIPRAMGRAGKKKSRKYTWERFVTRFDQKVGEVVTEVASSTRQ